MKITLKDVRLAFTDIWEAVPFEPGQTPKFGATLLVPKTDTKQIKLVEDTILTVAREGWGAKAEDMLAKLRPIPQKFCWSDGDTKEYDGFGGCMALSAKNESRPTIIDRDKSPLVQSDGRPYAGCYVVGSVDIWAQTKNYPGIRCKLRGLQFYRDGDAFTGGAPASADEFDDLSEGADASDLT